MGSSTDYVGASDEHMAGLVDHKDKIGHHRRIDRPSRAWPDHGGDLRNNAGGKHVTQEDIGITGERHYPLLDPRPAGVVQPDHWCPDLDRVIHHLADLLGVHLAE